MAEFLHGVIKSEVANKLLLADEGKTKTGKFLVRPKNSKSSDTYIISVIYKGKPSHHDLVRKKAGGPFTINKTTTGDATTIADAVEYLRTKRKKWPVPLTEHVVSAKRKQEKKNDKELEAAEKRIREGEQKKTEEEAAQKEEDSGKPKVYVLKAPKKLSVKVLKKATISPDEIYEKNRLKQVGSEVEKPVLKRKLSAKFEKQVRKAEEEKSNEVQETIGSRVDASKEVIPPVKEKTRARSFENNLLKNEEEREKSTREMQQEKLQELQEVKAREAKERKAQRAKEKADNAEMQKLKKLEAVKQQTYEDELAEQAKALALQAKEDVKHQELEDKVGVSRYSLKKSISGTQRKKNMQNTHPMLHAAMEGL